MECIECGEEFPNGGPPVCADCIDDYNQCDCCSNWFKDNGTPYCEDCEDNFAQCEDCDTWHHIDDLILIKSEEKSVCDRCIDRHYFCCSDCGDICSNSESLTTANGDQICDNCYSDNYFCCEDCGDIYYNDDYAGDGLCQNCYRDKPDIHEYNYKPEPIFHGVTNPYYGIELETDYYNKPSTAADRLNELSNGENDFYLKEDGSLDDGIEIVFHPRNFKSWHEFDMQPILSSVTKNGGKSFKTRTCGLHIHRSNKDLSTVTKIKLILFFGFCSEQIVTLAQRRTDFARFTPFTEIPDKGVCYKVIKKGEHAEERFQAINFRNKETIEFRVFKGTLKLSTIMAYLEFCHYVVEFCKGALLYEFIEGNTLWTKFIQSISDKNKLGIDNLLEYLKNKELTGDKNEQTV